MIDPLTGMGPLVNTPLLPSACKLVQVVLPETKLLMSNLTVRPLVTKPVAPGVGVGVGLAVGFGVLVGLKVGVGVGLLEGLGDGVGLLVGLGVGVGLLEGLGVGVGLLEGLGEGVGVGERLGEGVGLFVGIGVGVGVGKSVSNFPIMIFGLFEPSINNLLNEIGIFTFQLFCPTKNKYPPDLSIQLFPPL